MSSLNSYRIEGLPPDFYYIPNFVSVEEEASILQKIPTQRWTQLTHRRLQAHPSTLTKNNVLLAAPLPNYLTNPVIDRFKHLGIFDETPHRQPNHVLINEYKPGEGIMPHEDGDAYAPVVATVSLGGALCLDISPKVGEKEDGGDEKREVTEITSGGDSEDEPATTTYKVPCRIFQEPRSLLITTGDAYRHLLHGIASVEVDENLGAGTVANWSLLADPHSIEEGGGRNVRSTRISLTYRDVLKVSSAASKVFGGLQKR
ncbi:Nn.00g027660.m01.CDS01 [Neocucurbitaria sp. VM-36]